MYLILFLILCLIFIYYNYQTYKSVQYGNYTFFVGEGYGNYEEAAALIGRTNEDVLKLLRFLKNKYRIDETDDEQNIYTERYTGTVDQKLIVGHLLDYYNPEHIYETDPKKTNDTSFMVNKGLRFHICVRDKKDPSKLTPYDVLMFVVIHELSHIGAFDAIDHPVRFWKVFKFLLNEAVAAGIYTPVDYRQHPVNYCGLDITYNPYFDERLD